MAARKSTSAAKKAPAKKKKTTTTASAKPAAKAAEPPVMELDSQVTIKNVTELKGKLSAAAAVASGNPVRIDAGSVESADTAALQLLVAFAREHTTDKGAINWVKTSEAFVAAACQLDLDGQLGLDAAGGSTT